MQSISSTEFLKKYQSGGAYVIDVRTPDEFAYKHIPQAINIPSAELVKRLHEIPNDREVLFICQSGVRSTEACRQLDHLGLAKFATVEGGLNAFEKAGGQVIQVSQTLPLMRQVQIAAGSLVVLGIVLAQLIHPAFVYVSLFVGCGLVFAGVSGFCGMALLLAKMPWNQPKN